MNFAGPTPLGLADGLPVPLGWTLTTVLLIDKTSSLMRRIRSRCRCSKTRSRTPFFDQRFIRV